jgi:hypothetical protein
MNRLLQRVVSDAEPGFETVNASIPDFQGNRLLKFESTRKGRVRSDNSSPNSDLSRGILILQAASAKPTDELLNDWLKNFSKVGEV